MADNDIRKLLNYIISNPVAALEAQAEQLTAKAREPDEQLQGNIEHEVQTEQEAADRMLSDFAAGLRLAARGRSGGPIILDDTDPAQDLMAGALVRFLVIPNLATVETTELGDGRYRYAISVDWPALERVAQHAGVELSSALS